MKKIIYPAATRGSADYGWLKANYSFSFSNYYDPARIHFGKLRVLNDDQIDPDQGFGTHPHDNMEIITIPLSGELAHKDSMGHVSVIHENEVQVMSAGRGITHSEFNNSKTSSFSSFRNNTYPDKLRLNLNSIIPNASTPRLPLV